jgi:kinesin family protein C2/C3
VAQVFAVGRANRAVAATACNEQSSRSHCVLLIDLEAVDRDTAVKSHGRLVLVDLAGSERVGRSGVVKEQLTEAQNINKSLSALGDVIGALTSKAAHVPFRNSTLTFLLKDSLGKDNKALMLVQARCVFLFCRLVTRRGRLVPTCRRRRRRRRCRCHCLLLSLLASL